MKKEISEEAKKTAKHIGIISEGAIQTLIDEALQQERERIIEVVERKINPKIKNDGDEGWSDFSGSWDEFNEAIGYNQALVDLKKNL